VLLVVDVQKGFDRFNEEGHRNNPARVQDLCRLGRHHTFDNVGPDGVARGLAAVRTSAGS
jgi:hypothetical protein